MIRSGVIAVSMGMGHGDESGDRSRYRYRYGSPASKPGFSDGVPVFTENATSKHLEAD